MRTKIARGLPPFGSLSVGQRRRCRRPALASFYHPIVTAAQGPSPCHEGEAEQHWPAADVEASPAKRPPEKVRAGERDCKLPMPSSEGRHIPGAAGSLIP